MASRSGKSRLTSQAIQSRHSEERGDEESACCRRSRKSRFLATLEMTTVIRQNAAVTSHYFAGAGWGVACGAALGEKFTFGTSRAPSLAAK